MPEIPGLFGARGPFFRRGKGRKKGTAQAAPGRFDFKYTPPRRAVQPPKG